MAPGRRAEAISHGQSQQPHRTRRAAHQGGGKPVDQGGLGDRAGQPGVGGSKLDNVHPSQRCALGEDLTRLDAGLSACAADDGAIVLELAREAELSAGLAA
jgi:hypothetical protein